MAQQALIERLFEQFNRYLDRQGYQARKGQIVDASIVPAPRQRNSRKENAQIKLGDVPADWEAAPNKLRQKDTEARWAQKHGQNYYGYTNHVNVDHAHKLIRRFEVTDAAVHDSQVFNELLDPLNNGACVWADSAYRSVETEQMLKDNGYWSQIHHKGNRNQPLSEHQQRVNRKRSRVRARVEHIFGSQHNTMGGKFIRTVGMVWAPAKIGLMNLGYNFKRSACWNDEDTGSVRLVHEA